jgi:hypothetical protein
MAGPLPITQGVIGMCACGTGEPRPARRRTDTENWDEKIPSDTAFCVWFGRTLEITLRKLTQKIKTGTPCQCVI